MRPLHLDIQAFGPYAGRQEIDFSELKDYRFFLIHGPTGENMRSDYATDDQITEVTFDFVVGQDRYRVRRAPKQRIARKRGTGFTEIGESAVLFQLDTEAAARVFTLPAPLATTAA